MTADIAFSATTFASEPAEWRGLERDEVRMLVARPGAVEHQVFGDLPAALRPGDVVVVNNSATLAAEVDATWRGVDVVVHVAHRLDDGAAVVELRTAPDAARAVLGAEPGEKVHVGRARLTVESPWPVAGSPTGVGNRLWRVAVDGDLDAALERGGRPIAYGYLGGRFPLTAYQTVFAARPGSAEMPSAARPFTTEVVTRLVSRGVGVVPVTLHTGVSSQEAGEVPGPEWFEVPAATARAVNAARAGGGRVVAVGTTVTRALESAVRDGAVAPARGWTERIVTPEDPPRVVSGLVSGWHDAEASHLLLVEAVAGPAITRAAYEAAVAAGYLWHEFGDSSLLLPDVRSDPG